MAGVIDADYRGHVQVLLSIIWEKLITLTVLASALLNWLSFPILHWKAKLQTPLIPQIAAHVVLEVLVPMIII